MTFFNISRSETTRKSYFSWLISLMLCGLLLFTFAPVLSLDTWRLGMFLTYPPRILLLPFALLCTLYFIWVKAGSRFFLSLTAILLLVFQAGFNPFSRQTEHPKAFTLLSFNIHNARSDIDDLKKLCLEKNVDFLSLQEANPISRKLFISKLDDYQFFWADESKNFRYAKSGAFDSLIGIKKALLEQSSVAVGDVEVETGITQYRTFSARIPLQDHEFYLINVHTTKPLWLRDSLYEMLVNMDSKSARHVGEMDDLRQWIQNKQKQHGLPIIIAGDFNAPYYSHNLKFPGFNNAHQAAGKGLHLTFPAAFPIFGLDHIFATQQIKLLSYQTLKTRYSDHYAQLLRFRL